MLNIVSPSSSLFRTIRATALTLTIGMGVGGAPVMASESQDPKVAIRAVQSTLPSVAILGQKAGPAGSTEVFIQVPGVLNMQSVYVLSDGKTVISGVVVPPIENGYPGAQLSLPDGNATVNPRAPRSGAQQLNEVLGITPPTPAAMSGADKANDFSVPPVPAQHSAPVPGSGGADARTVGDEIASSPVSAPVVAPTVARSEGAPSQASNVDNLSSNGGILIESLADVAQTGAFSKVVGHALDNNSDILAVKELAGKSGQTEAYLDLVKSLPAIVQGDSDRKVYVMFDPNCPVCHRYYSESKALVDVGELEIHWIPSIVFADTRSSLTASAALLAEAQRSDGDPLAMLHQVMTTNTYAQRIDSAPNVDRLVPYLDAVAKNTAVMVMARAETPLLVFEDTSGALKISAGIPRNGYHELIQREG